MRSKRKSDRPTLAPGFDVGQFARDSDRRLRSQAPGAHDAVDVDLDALKGSETRLATRPRHGGFLTNEAWIQSMSGVPFVALAGDALKRLPLDHRAGFVLSLMDGSLDVETVVELCGMPRHEALSLIRDLFESDVVRFR